MKKVKREYPGWICHKCAKENGGKWPDGHLGTVHMGTCGWCNRLEVVTEPRDYGYPEYKPKKQINRRIRS